MRHHILAAAIVATAALATACTTGTGTGSTPVSDSVNGKQLTFIPGVSGDSFYLTMQCGIQAEAKKLGMNVDTQAPQAFDPSLQTPIVNAAAAKRPAAILVAPTDATAMLPPLLRAKQAGSAIGLVDTTLQDTSIASTAVSTDNSAAGAAAADALAKLVGEKGKVMVIAFQAGASTSDERQHGFEQEIKKYPGITNVGAQINDNDPAKAASIVSATLAAHPDLTGIFATNQFAAQGAATGLRNAGKVGQVQIVGFDAGPVQVEQLQQGSIQALIAQQPYQIGVDAVDQMAAALTGKPVTKNIPSGTVTITRDNLAQPASQQALYKTTC
ncbi:ABC transporter substrate-binding protein [Amycolatopsis acidiphila]|uniref:Substrate-binding domain-containing protein n=1 Tax=Amycolatopsis acidiphila TaxID=715473 RepID=A0A558ACK1_9PSEU|nr:ABC transporter substrate-binding protein [Amycolatopsis acidiphila]TVT21923.1 substrate-binding domain-containing protein [Amycolatopsis acidiphila]UIJ57345.1 ABC transporter substrate-binding protein [Amycolatopsis acidiphila]GHG84686.1 sugar ABC transporter substrate-binding protein [Amycolatopsis acidiphila]